MSKEMVQLNTLKAGEVISAESGRKYLVLKQEEEQTKIISVDFMAENEIFDSDSPDYKMSELKKKIETDIQPLIEADFGADNLVEHEVDLTTVDMQKDFGFCICKVRPITFDEAREHNDLIVKKDLPDWWWTCTPWSTKERGWNYALAVVCPSGYVRDDFCYCGLGVRPVCIFSSVIFGSEEE